MDCAEAEAALTASAAAAATASHLLLKAIAISMSRTGQNGVRPEGLPRKALSGRPGPGGLLWNRSAALCGTKTIRNVRGAKSDLQQSKSHFSSSRNPHGLIGAGGGIDIATAERYHGGRRVRIIVSVLASGLGWWLIWLAFGRPETWPYLAAYIVAGPLLFFCWGWAEEKLGFKAAGRPEDEAPASTVQHAAELGMPVEEAELRAEVGDWRDDQQPLPRVNAPDPWSKAPGVNAPERRGRAVADTMR